MIKYVLTASIVRNQAQFCAWLTLLGRIGPQADAELYLPADRCSLVPVRLMKFYYVYILKSLRHDFIYIGFTENLKQRFIEHNSGKSKSTKPYLPYDLIHYEAYKNIKDAKRREEYLKTNRGKTTLETMLKCYFNIK